MEIKKPTRLVNLIELMLSEKDVNKIREMHIDIANEALSLRFKPIG